MEQPIRRKPRRRRTKTLDRKQLLIVGCVIGAVALIIAALIFLLSGSGGEKVETPRGPLKPLTIGQLTRDGESMVVENSYLEVRFAYAFSDLIRVEAVNQETKTAMEFSARIAGEDRKIYCIWFNSQDGQTVGTLDLQDGEAPVRVSAVFYQPDAQLSEEDRKTFAATQETVNDVIAAMRENMYFVEARG